MRTIKFRGKRINRNGEWAYGDLRILPDRTLILSQGTYDAAIDRDEVDKSTVGQFTGLTDKDGAEIYEGDIVELREPNGMPNICKVEMCEKGYWCVSFGIHERIILGFIDKNQITVIGNIHDNPELMKENKMAEKVIIKIMKPSTFNFKLSTMRPTRRKKLHRRAVAKIRRYYRCFHWCLRRIDDMVKATMPTELKRDERINIKFFS